MTDHPQEHASLDDFADKVEASGHDKLRKPLGWMSPELLKVLETPRSWVSTGTFYLGPPQPGDIAIYTQPQLDALIAEARAEERRRCGQHAYAVIRAAEDAMDRIDTGEDA